MKISNNKLSIIIKISKILICFADTVLEGEDIYPEVGETVKRVAYRAYEPHCKTKAFNISIKNCGSYFVYYLVSTGGCPGAYCFGKFVLRKC